LTKFLVCESGFVFGAGDGSDHYLYNVTDLENIVESEYFLPRAKCANMEICDKLLNLGNITDMLARDLLNSSQ